MCTVIGTSTTCSFSANTAGNTIIFVGRFAEIITSPTITDTVGNTYTVRANLQCSSAGQNVVALEASTIGGTASTNTLTFSWTGSGTMDGEAFEYSGLAASAFDKSACTRVGGATSPTSGNTATTAFANELVFSFFSSNAVVVTRTDGTTVRSSDGVGNGGQWINSWADKNVTSTGTQAATGTCSSGTVMSAVFTFKAASQPGGAASTQAGAFVIQ